MKTQIFLTAIVTLLVSLYHSSALSSGLMNAHITNSTGQVVQLQIGDTKYCMQNGHTHKYNQLNSGTNYKITVKFLPTLSPQEFESNFEFKTFCIAKDEWCTKEHIQVLMPDQTLISEKISNTMLTNDGIIYNTSIGADGTINIVITSRNLLINHWCASTP